MAPATGIYRYRRGEGWIIVDVTTKDEPDYDIRFTMTLYFIGGDEPRVETYNARNPITSVRQMLDIGGRIGNNEAKTKAKPSVEYAEQPRPVRMQRHAVDIYDALENTRGVSPTLALRAAEQFGSRWAEKKGDEWQERVQGIGKGRADRIHETLHE